MAPPTRRRMRDQDARNAVEFILQRQNPDGGFGTYESRRSWLNLSAVNPSEMYGDCMSERTFTECTSSCVAALVAFLDSSVTAPAGLRRRARKAVACALRAISRRQREDGSFAGSWGINFTFGTFHAIEALSLGGVPTSDPRIEGAVQWLLSKQKEDGGWGEHWHSCARDEYVEHPETQATMTAWALLGLLRALPATHPAIERGVAALQRLQQEDGSWPRQAPAGVFFVTCVLDYLYYKDYFPTWALARYAHARQRLPAG